MLVRSGVLFVASILTCCVVPTAMADHLPPLPPTGVSAVAQDGSVNVTWSAPPGDIVEYTVYRSGEMLGSTGLTWFLDTSPTPLAVYTVTAMDSEGGESAPGGPAAASEGQGPACFHVLPFPPDLEVHGCIAKAIEIVDWVLGTADHTTPIPLERGDVLGLLGERLCFVREHGSTVSVHVGLECVQMALDTADWAGAQAMDATWDVVGLFVQTET